MHSPKDFKILKTKIVYDHFLKVKQDIVKTPNGHIVDYNYLDGKKGAVIVLPIFEGKIVMIKQYRYPLKKYVYDLPAGGVDKGFTRKESAIKELREETGFVTEKLKFINSFYQLPGNSNSVVHAYLAKDLVKKRKRLEKSEFAEVVYFSVKDFEKLLLTEKMEGNIAATYFSAKLKNMI